MNDKIKNTKMTSKKTKMTAILITIFLGIFVWLYTIKKSAPKFIIDIFYGLFCYVAMGFNRYFN